MAKSYFTPRTLAFLKAISKNNTREWFDVNKPVYETLVREPALAFITDMASDLAMISPHFLALPRKVGGSLMRVHRDVRFSKNKLPYKTNIGIQFRHEQGKDVHAPGYYLHIEPHECFVGVGIWHPEAPVLGKIRDAIVEKPAQWHSAIDGKTFKRHFELSGESLKRPPKGYAKDHPCIEDLKRKDFIAIAPLDPADISTPRFKKQVLDRFVAAEAYMQFLCKALQLRY